jgi:hypothetical protein
LTDKWVESRGDMFRFYDRVSIVDLEGDMKVVVTSSWGLYALSERFGWLGSLPAGLAPITEPWNLVKD